MKKMMKNATGRWIGGALLAAGVAAVFLIKVKPEDEPADTTVRPIKSLVVGADAPRPKLYFPGTVEADVEVNLSFEVGGRLVEFPVRRGMVVAQGDVLGKLDPRNYENQVKNAEADLERAQSSLGRIEKALKVNAVSQDEYSQARAAVAKAEAQLAIQRKALDDTRLEARFRGVVSDTFADNYDTVSPGQPVLKLQDESGSLDRYFWSFVGHKPIVNRWNEMKQVPATSAESDALSKDLKKRGFRFVGSTIIYAHMQATGMVNDHLVGCFRYKACKQLR